MIISFKSLSNLFRFFVNPFYNGVQLSLYNLPIAIWLGSIKSITGSAYSYKLAVQNTIS